MPRGRLSAWVARGAQEIEWAERHEESTSCREASKDRGWTVGIFGCWAGAGRMPVFQAGGRVGGSCGGPGPSTSLLRSADERAQPGGMVRLTRRLPALRRGEQGPG